MNARVSIVKCNGYEPYLIDKAVKESVELLGGMANFIRPKSRVFVKPNLLMAKEPEYGITTHPEVVRSVIKILKGIECRILVGDSPSVWGKQIENVERVYKITGIEKVCLEEGVELIKLDKREWRGDFPLAECLRGCDAFINLPKFKTHEFTILTGAIKNLFGLVVGTYKTELHKKYFKDTDFSAMLVDIYEKAKPALTIVDGIIAMEGDGPATAGSIRKENLIVTGEDCLAIDTILALIMGVKPDFIPTNKEAALRKLGVSDLKLIEILGQPLKNVVGRPFKLPASSLRRKIPLPIAKALKSLIRLYPRIDNSKCIRCRACIKACPQKIISMCNNRIRIDYRGCISCFCCQEVCPEAAIGVKKSLLAKIVGL